MRLDIQIKKKKYWQFIWVLCAGFVTQAAT